MLWREERRSQERRRVDSILLIAGLCTHLNLNGTSVVSLEGRLEKCGGTSKGGSPEPVDRIRQILSGHPKTGQ